MNFKNAKRFVALATVGTITLGFTGCSFGGNNLTQLPLSKNLTVSELKDYYAKALEYDSVVSRNVTVHENTYELQDIGGEKAQELQTLAKKVEALLSKKEYKANDVTIKLLTTDNFNYIKASIDNYSLSSPVIKSIKGALGYYFVDIEYKLGPSQEAKMNEMAGLVGINGAITYSEFHKKYEVNTNYLKGLVKVMNKYYEENHEPKKLVLNESSGKLELKNTHEDFSKDDTASNTSSDATQYDNKAFTVTTDKDRMNKIELDKINEVGGSSVVTEAAMPEVYDICKVGGGNSLSGFGLFNAGNSGLKEFGYDRSKLSGSLTLRYVFKDDSKGTGEILGTNVYIASEEVTNGVTNSENNILLADFLNTKLSETIERADRVVVDGDLPGMLSGNIFENIGVGILNGYKRNYANITKYMSTIRQVLNRKTENNSYLLEVETTTTEGAKDVDAYGTYKDISLVTVQQQNDKFIITDWLRTSRTLQHEPDIDPDNVATKRLISLNLSSDVNEDSKKYITQLLGDLYTSGTNKFANDKTDEKTGDKYKGIYSCFCKDTELLSEDKYNYETNLYMNTLVKYGSESEIRGTVTQWLGGYEDQAELTTEELITFSESRAIYSQVYYLVQKVKDNWVITERKVIDSYDLNEKSKVDDVLSRIK